MEPNVKQYGGMAGSAGESDAVWLLQPDGIFAQVLHDVAGAGCGSNACTHVFFPHPQKTSCFLGCYSRRWLLQPAVGGGSIQLFEHGPGVLPKGPEQPRARSSESIGQKHEVGHILGEHHVGLAVLALAFR